MSDDNTATPAAQGFAAIPRSMLHDPAIHGDCKLVYLVLASHAGGNRTAWPSHRRIAELLGLSVSGVKLRLKWLRAHGYITWTQRQNEDGGQASNSYVILVGSLTAAPNEGSYRVPTPSHEVASPGQAEAGVLAKRRLGGSHPVATNENHPNERTTSEAKPPTQDVIDLCNRLADRIEANGSRRPAVGKGWLDACRLMIERDGREPEKIAAAIDWCQAHEFWRSVILSMSKLREKYDQLRLAAQAASGGASARRPQQVDRIAAGRAAGRPEAWL